MNVKPTAKGPDDRPGVHRRADAAKAAPMLDALVLAAGRGSRFGGRKLLAPWRGGVVLEGALRAAFAAPVRGVTLVVGADGPDVSAAARRWAEAAGEPARLAVVEARDWESGLSASVKAGLAALEPGSAGTFVFLGDMPRIPLEVLGALAAALSAGAAAAIPAWRGELGHPVLIGAGLFPQMAMLQGDRGARAVLERLGSALVRVEAPDDGVLFDVDTPADLARA